MCFEELKAGSLITYQGESISAADRLDLTVGQIAASLNCCWKRSESFGDRISP